MNFKGLSRLSDNYPRQFIPVNDNNEILCNTRYTAFGIQVMYLVFCVPKTYNDNHLLFSAELLKTVRRTK